MAQQLQNRADIDLSLSTNPVMKLRFYDGNTLTFTGHPTDEARYGSSGETVFMEIASNTIACTTPSSTTTPCLQVRDVYYNDKGIITGKSTWHPFYPDIRGYQHKEGVGHILRLKRYNLQNTGNTPSQVYVLDMIVQ